MSIVGVRPQYYTSSLWSSLKNGRVICSFIRFELFHLMKCGWSEICIILRPDPLHVTNADQANADDIGDYRQEEHGDQFIENVLQPDAVVENFSESVDGVGCG